MTYQIGEFIDGQQITRDATPEETAEIDARIAAAAIPAIPQVLTRRQAVQVLINDGKLASVQPAINALDDGTPQGAMMKATAQNEWDNSNEFHRERPLLIQLAYAIGYDSAGLDQLFVQGVTL